MDLYQLKYFLAVVETGSFTRAAQQCFVTQPSLSAGIKKLEGQIGRDLFARSNRRVFLTEAGNRFLPRARAIVHEYNQALEVVSEAENRVLRLGVLSTIADRRLQGLVAVLRQQFIDLAIEIRDGSEQELLNRLDDRSIDFAITIDRGDNRYACVPLVSEGYSFILPSGHALSGKQAISTEELTGEHMIVRSRCELLSETSRHFTDNNIRPRLVYRTANDARAVAMVAGGLGGTIVPDGWVDDRVTAVRVRGFSHQRRLAVLYPDSAPGPFPADKGEQFCGFVADHAAAHWQG